MLLSLSTMADAQWTQRPSCAEVLDYCSFGEGTLCICKNAAFVVDGDGEMQILSRGHGLGSAYVSAGAASGNTIAIGYEDSSMDIIRGGRTIHIDCIASGNFLHNSAIRQIIFSGDLILACGDFGIAKVDSQRAQVLAVCNIGQPVARCAVSGGRVYLMLPDITVSIDADSPYFQDPDHWSRSDSFLFGPDAAPYNGPHPNTLPSDYVAYMASQEGSVIIASRFFSELSKRDLRYVENPDGVDFSCAFYNPYNSSHVFLGAVDGTLYEYLGHSLRSRHQGHVHGRIVGMECTPEGDLLILSHDRSNPVMVFDHNGNWHAAESFRSMNCPNPRQLIRVDEYVFAVAMGDRGIFVLDMRGTPLDFNDDVSASTYPNSGGRVGSEVNCLAMDPDGRLVAGTNAGVVYYPNPGKICDGAADCVRPVVSESMGASETYSQYLLHSRCVTSMDVDAAGRKWIATRDAGVFLVSSDMDSELMRLNERNSQLPSDTVFAINIVQQTGEVFFATRNGVASYMSGVEKPAQNLDRVIVYPNPVRPDYEGSISISGLEDGCDVRITDISGHLVYKCESLGGRVEWDGQNLSGRRCASGVYLVFVVNVASGHKIVKKLLIVR